MVLRAVLDGAAQFGRLAEQVGSVERGQLALGRGEVALAAQQIVRERGIPVNPNLRREMQAMRDGLGIPGYEAYF